MRWPVRRWRVGRYFVRRGRIASPLDCNCAGERNCRGLIEDGLTFLSARPFWSGTTVLCGSDSDLSTTTTVESASSVGVRPGAAGRQAKQDGRQFCCHHPRGLVRDAESMKIAIRSPLRIDIDNADTDE